MGHGYQAIQWNRQKRIYDTVILVGVLSYLGLFLGVGMTMWADATFETLMIRALGTLAFLMLHIVLTIGPLARFDSRFLPLLYNRRHLGVATFLVALFHGLLSTLQFHAFGNVNPLISLLASNTRFTSLSQFPFQLLGLSALAILSVMAVTSHDFWLANLSPLIWKSIHMLVYVAYGLLVAHVVLGALQTETHPILVGVLAIGFVWVVGLHLIAASRERRLDRESYEYFEDGMVRACSVAEIQNDRARIVTLDGERVAIFRYDGKISAVSNVCRHQNGPLGEGKIIDGCITCPWHGYQYSPRNGTAPPPFTEKVSTFNVRVVDGEVWVDPTPNPPGTTVAPAREGTLPTLFS